MITDEQVERVARAIYEATGYDFDGRTINAAGQPYGAWALAIKQARAALEAARAPEVEPRSLFGIPVVVSDAVPEGSVVIRSAPEVVGEVEAVAFRHKWKGEGFQWVYYETDQSQCDPNVIVEPLYLHPPQSRRDGMEEAARIADRYAKQNREEASKQRAKAAKIARLGDVFGHGDAAQSAAFEIDACANEAEAIAQAIREAAKEKKDEP
jgi:hypothetical protein